MTADIGMGDTLTSPRFDNVHINVVGVISFDGCVRHQTNRVTVVSYSVSRRDELLHTRNT